MKILVSAVIVWIIFLSFSRPGLLGHDTPSPFALNTNFVGGLGNVHFDPISEVLSQMMEGVSPTKPTNEHLCMNLSPQEVQNLSMMAIHYGDINAEQAGETCNSQLITVNEQNMYLSAGTNLSFMSLLHINYYEFSEAIQAKILDIMGNQEVDRLDPQSASLQNTQTDIIVLRKHKVIREVRNNNTSNTPGTKSPFTALTCILTAHIPTGLLQLEYDENNNQKTNKINKVDLCQIPVLALEEIWQHHTRSDADSPKFCLTLDNSWLTAHNLAFSSASMGCQQQTLIWKNAPDVVDPNNQITLEIRRDYLPAFRSMTQPNTFGAPGVSFGIPSRPAPGIPFRTPGMPFGMLPGSQNPLQSGQIIGNSPRTNPFAPGPVMSPGAFPTVSPNMPQGAFGPVQNGTGPMNNPFEIGAATPFGPAGVSPGFPGSPGSQGGFGPLGPLSPQGSQSMPSITGTPTKIADQLGFLYTDPGFGTLQVNKAKLIIPLPDRQAMVLKVASQNLSMTQVSALITDLAEYQIKNNFPHKK